MELWSKENKAYFLLITWYSIDHFLKQSTWCQKWLNMARDLCHIDPLIIDKHLADNWSKLKKTMAQILKCWSIRHIEEGAGVCTAELSLLRWRG